MRKVLLALTALSFAAPAAAQQMNAQEFYERATKLKKKGAMAVFSMGEVKKLMAEGQAAGKASATKLKADKAAGRPLAYCPPSEAKIGSDEYMTLLARIPLAERKSINMTQATHRIMAFKYPCPA